MAIDLTISRQERGDSKGRTIEDYVDSPGKLSQLNLILDFIQHWLCHVTLGSDDEQYSLKPEDFSIRYLQIPSRDEAIGHLEPGWWLALLANHRVQPSDDDIARLRDAAHRAGLAVLNNDGMLPAMLESDDPCDWGPGFDPKHGPAAVARRTHQKLKGKRVETAFALSFMDATPLNFTGHFAGDEVSSEAGSPVAVNGLIDEVVYRGQTLSFRLDVTESTDARLVGTKINIEYASRQRKLVHGFAVYWEDACSAEVRVQHRTDKSGVRATVYSLSSLTSGTWSTAGQSEFEPPRFEPGDVSTSVPS